MAHGTSVGLAEPGAHQITRRHARGFGSMDETPISRGWFHVTGSEQR